MQEIVERKAQLLKADWFVALIEDCRDTIVEKRWRIAAELLEMKWHIGDRILQDTANFERSQIYGRQIIVTVSKALDCSEREIYRCVQFRRKYPELGALPEGKNISWHKIVNQYLPNHGEDDDPEAECRHERVEVLVRCARCRERLLFRRQERDSMIDLGKKLSDKTVTECNMSSELTKGA